MAVAGVPGAGVETVIEASASAQRHARRVFEVPVDDLDRGLADLHPEGMAPSTEAKARRWSRAVGEALIVVTGADQMTEGLAEALDPGLELVDASRGRLRLIVSCTPHVAASSGLKVVEVPRLSVEDAARLWHLLTDNDLVQLKLRNENWILFSFFF